MLLCSVYKGSTFDEMYLYVKKADGLDKVPEVLLSRFGDTKEVMSLLLTAERPLARVDVETVIEAIEAKGFFLQMPASKEAYVLDLLPDYKTSQGYCR